MTADFAISIKDTFNDKTNKNQNNSINLFENVVLHGISEFSCCF